MAAELSKILFLGDVFLRGVHRGPSHLDLPFVMNLEAPFVDSEAPVPGKISLGMRWADFDQTFPVRPLAVCLANNHILDYGYPAFHKTIRMLRKARIPHFGAGPAEENFANPLFIHLNGHRIALLGYCSARPCLSTPSQCGPAPLEHERILRDIRRHRTKADRIFIHLHWGKEEASLPDKAQVDLARTLIDAGADAIIGHHPHAIQPVETYRGGIIAYSLGNYIFPDLHVPASHKRGGFAEQTYTKRQRKWNRSSIGLVIDTADMEVELRYFYQRGSRTLEKRNRCHRYAEKAPLLMSDNLDRMAARRLRLRHLNIMCFNFIRGPSLTKLVRFFRNRAPHR